MKIINHQIILWSQAHEAGTHSTDDKNEVERGFMCLEFLGPVSLLKCELNSEHYIFINAAQACINLVSM